MSRQRRPRRPTKPPGLFPELMVPLAVVVAHVDAGNRSAARWLARFVRRRPGMEAVVAWLREQMADPPTGPPAPSRGQSGT